MMNQTHLHLVLNHLPIVGVMLSGVLLAIALLLKNGQFQRVCLALLVVFALVAIPVYLTGESAEHAAKRSAGVSKALVEQHEEAAKVTLVAVEILGGAALLAALVTWRAVVISGAFGAIVLVLTFGASALFAWTGYLGGQIRHPDVRSGSVISQPTGREGRTDRTKGDARWTRPGSKGSKDDD